MNMNWNYKFICFFPQECVNPLDLRRLVSISMDGPNVNFKCFELFQQEHAERYGGSQLIQKKHASTYIFAKLKNIYRYTNWIYIAEMNASDSKIPPTFIPFQANYDFTMAFLT